jgi:hypothetical protein
MVANISIYDELSGFIASMNPDKVVAFKPSKANQERLDFLLDKQREKPLTVEERTELEHYLIINRIVGLAKAQAMKMLRA